MTVTCRLLEVDGGGMMNHRMDDSGKGEKNKHGNAVPSSVNCKVLYTRGAGIEFCAEDNSTLCGNQRADRYCKSAHLPTLSSGNCSFFSWPSFHVTVKQLYSACFLNTRESRFKFQDGEKGI
jgi:hypothetical protein